MRYVTKTGCAEATAQRGCFKRQNVITCATVQVCTHKHAAEAISAVQYAPGGHRLAAGSHDNAIYIYSTAGTYELLRRCQGHSSYITHLDWSADGSLVQSNCGAYEVLYWDAKTGRQACSSQRDTRWAKWTCTLGFPVMGVFPQASDGTDVNSLCRSFTSRDVARQGALSDMDPLAERSGRYVVTGDDGGGVRLYAYPCVAARALCRTYRAHSAHVASVRFAYDNRCATPAPAELAIEFCPPSTQCARPESGCAWALDIRWFCAVSARCDISAALPSTDARCFNCVPDQRSH